MILWWPMSWELETLNYMLWNVFNSYFFNFFQKWFDCFAPPEISTCVFPDGRDHSVCCKESLVPSSCDNICRFSHHDELSADFITCVTYTGIIANCYREGLGDFLLIRINTTWCYCVICLALTSHLNDLLYNDLSLH